MAGLSVRTMLLALVAGVALPLVGLLAWVLVDEIEAREDLARRLVVDRATWAARETARILEQTDRIGRHYTGGAPADAGCLPLPRDLASFLPMYANILVTDREGTVLCSVVPLTREPAARLSASTVFRRAVDGRAPVRGSPQLGLITGEWLVLHVYPRLDESGAVVGAVAVALSVARLGAALARAAGQEGDVVTLLTSDGMVIARSRDALGWVGQRVDDPRLHAAPEGGVSEPFESGGVDSVRRYVATASIPGSDWIVHAGLDRDVVLEPVLASRSRAALLIVLSLLLALAAAWYASRWIARPMIGLARVAGSVGRGDPRERAVPDGPAEVALVARELNAALDARDRASIELATVIDHSPEFIHLTDREGRLLLGNRAFLHSVGNAPAVVRGQRLADFVRPDLAARFAHEHALVLRTGEPLVVESAIPSRDGMRPVLINRFPVRAPDGSIRAVGSIAIDMTAQRRLVDALRASEARFKTLADSAPVGIYQCDAAGACVYVNQRWCEISGMRASDALGSGWVSSLHPDERAPVLAAIARPPAPDDQRALETRFLTPAGETRWALCRTIALQQEDGSFAGVLGTVIDISARKLAEQRDRAQVARLEQLSRELLDVQEAERRAIAHELHDEVGQTLTAVNVRLQRLGQRADPSLAQDLAATRALVDRVIDQIRDTSLALRPVMLDELGLVPALRWLVERVRESSAIDLRLEVDAPAADVPASVATVCFRVAQEALTNVLRHARAKSARVTLREATDGLALGISDDGEGFVVGGEATARRGFGQSAMAERVASVGGTIAIRSEPGAGTHIDIWLPLSVPGSSPD